jgi:hypothetical protein
VFRFEDAALVSPGSAVLICSALRGLTYFHHDILAAYLYRIDIQRVLCWRGRVRAGANAETATMTGTLDFLFVHNAVFAQRTLCVRTYIRGSDYLAAKEVKCNLPIIGLDTQHLAFP